MIRDIVNERIINRRMNILLFFIVTNDLIKRINFKTYINKDIQTNVIFDMNKLNKKENDIIL